jgi:hypothetical protein
MKHKIPTFCCLLVLLLSISFVSCKKNEVIENDLQENVQIQPYTINGNTAFIDVSFDRSLDRFSEVIVGANNTVLNSADIIKQVVDNNPNIEEIVLRINNTCKDDYGNISNHIDEISFNSSDILEFKKYKQGENIAYNCSLYFHKLKELWTPCGAVNPSSLVY